MLAVCAAPCTSSAGRAAPASACRTSALVVWLDTQGDGAAGSVYYSLRFTNLSGSRCTLHGYPGVSAVDLRGRQIGTAGSRNPSAVPVVTLGAGKTAQATLRIVQAANFPSARCRLVTAAGIRVYPPNQRASKVVPFPFSACSRRGPAILGISPVKP